MTLVSTAALPWSSVRPLTTAKDRAGKHQAVNLTDLSTSPKQVYLPGPLFWKAFRFQNVVGVSHVGQ